MIRSLMTLAATLTLSVAAFSEENSAALNSNELTPKNQGNLIEHATFSLIRGLDREDNSAALHTYELTLKNEGNLIEHATFSVIRSLDRIESKTSYEDTYTDKNGNTSHQNAQVGYLLVLHPLEDHHKDYASLSFTYYHPPSPKQARYTEISRSDFSSVVHLPPGKEFCKDITAKDQSVQLCLKQL